MPHNHPARFPWEFFIAMAILGLTVWIIFTISANKEAKK